MTYEYRITCDKNLVGDFASSTPVPPTDSEGWRLHSHSTCYEPYSDAVHITFVWEREAQS